MKLSRQPLAGLICWGVLGLALTLAIGCGGESDADEQAEPAPSPAADQGRDGALPPDAPLVVRPEPPDPTDPRTQALEASLAALTEQRYGDAIDILNDALIAYPDEPILLEGLATVYQEAGHHDLALATCRQILSSAPADTKALYNAGVALMRLERYDEAEAPLRTLLAIEPDHLEALTNLAVCLQAQGKLAEARQSWQDLLAIEDTAANHFDVGVILMDLDEPAAALDHFRRAAALDPNDYDVRLNLAAAARAVGSYGFAVVALRQATDLRPDDPAGWAELGQTLLVIY
ncbi:MAG: tetratricopeptide repeat protein, partial [Planctomycetota bacterium]